MKTGKSTFDAFCRPHHCIQDVLMTFHLCEERNSSVVLRKGEGNRLLMFRLWKKADGACGFGMVCAILAWETLCALIFIIYACMFLVLVPKIMEYITMTLHQVLRELTLLSFLLKMLFPLKF